MQSDRKIFLEWLKKRDLSEKVPSISEKTAYFLHFLVRAKSSKRILEIGTAHGYSTIWFAAAVETLKKFDVSESEKPITTIEFSKPSFEQAKLNIYRAKCDNLIEQKLGDAKEILKIWCQTKGFEKFDFIFIDGQKRDTLAFFEFSEKLLEKNGIIVVDDVLKFQEKMSDFLEKVSQSSVWEFVVLPLDKDDGIMVLQRK